MLEIACMVDIGIRPKNDDRAAINSHLVSNGIHTETIDISCLVVVCDGVGGYPYGDEAAAIVTEIFASIADNQLNTEIINEYIIKANEAVITAQKTDANHSKMTTTIAGLYINGDDFIAFNIGDSRIYRYRSYISQISVDHSQNNQLIYYIGGNQAFPEIVEGTGRVFENDIYILCTDGVWGVLEEIDFEKILSAYEKSEDACKALITLAIEKGSKDNLSIIIVRRT